MNIFDKKDKNDLSTNLNTGFIKQIAILTMLIDHIGYVIYPNVEVMRIIGRISFPLFAYCIVIGYMYTKNLKKYFIRLFACFLISQPIYIIVFDYEWYYMNIFLTLIFGLLFINFFNQKKSLYLFIALVLSSFIYLDYSIYGTLLIFIIYFFIDNRKKLFVALFVYLSIGFIGNDISLLGLSFSKQGFAVLALPIIFFKTNINIYFNKYFYYSFYPIHLFGLLLYIRIK